MVCRTNFSSQLTPRTLDTSYLSARSRLSDASCGQRSSKARNDLDWLDGPINQRFSNSPVALARCPAAGGSTRSTLANVQAKRLLFRVGIASPGAEKWAWPAKGLIDDVRFYKKALSDAEIAAIYKDTGK